MTRAEAIRLIGTLAAAFPRQELHDDTIGVYAQEILDLDADLANVTVTQLIRTSRFFPAVAEIRDLAAEIQLDAPGSMEAWAQASQDDRVRHPLVNEARKLVGDTWYWRTAEADSLRPAFIGAYKEVRAAAVEHLAAPRPQLKSATPQIEA